MRTIIYVDGFNLYHRMLKRRPSARWLNLQALARNVLSSANKIVAVNYYTARVSGRLDPNSPGRQQVYLDALGSVPEIAVHMGMFLTSEKFASLIHPPDFRPPAVLNSPWPDVVRILKVEEKGSDVNLACHLLLDAFQDRYDVACVISNDSDLVEPIRIVTTVLKKRVGLLSPVDNPNPQLRAASTFLRRIRPGDLAASQFNDPLTLPDGSELRKPSAWV